MNEASPTRGFVVCRLATLLLLCSLSSCSLMQVFGSEEQSAPQDSVRLCPVAEDGQCAQAEPRVIEDPCDYHYHRHFGSVIDVREDEPAAPIAVYFRRLKRRFEVARDGQNIDLGASALAVGDQVTAEIAISDNADCALYVHSLRVVH